MTTVEDIKNNPEKHKHAHFLELRACCFEDGAISIALMDAHERYASQGSNGGVNCDVRSGPCSCGAWH